MEGNRKAIHSSGKDAVTRELRKRGFEKIVPLRQANRGHLCVSSPSNEANITVKAKMGPVWPKCMGVSGKDNFLVLVDFQGKRTGERPDFFIINQDDSLLLAELRMSEIKRTRPTKRMQIDPTNTVVFIDEICKSGDPYKGITIRPDKIASFQEKWEKIESLLSARD